MFDYEQDRSGTINVNIETRAGCIPKSPPRENTGRKKPVIYMNTKASG